MFKSTIASPAAGRAWGAAALALALWAPAGQAGAALVTFDDLAPLPDVSGGKIASGYAGLTWSEHFQYVKGSSIADSGYSRGLISGEYVAFASSGQPISIGRDSGFDLNSGYFTGAWQSMEILAQGFVSGSDDPFYSKTFTVTSSGPLLVDFGWTDLTQVRFTQSPYGFGMQFVIDNLTIDEAVQHVPEPASLALVLGGLALAGAAGRRRRR